MTTLALIEDNEQVRLAMASLLNGIPAYRVVSTHGSAEDALRSLPFEKVQLILVDIGLPGPLNGIDFVRQVASQHPNVVPLMFTVYEDAETLYKALSAGAQGYILKTVPPSEICCAIDDAIAGGAPMSRAIARKVLRYFRNPNTPRERFDLTQREELILCKMVDAKRDKEIASELGIAYHTVRSHVRNIYKKLQVSSRAEAIQKAQSR